MWYRALILSRVLTFAEAPIPLLAGIDRGSQRNWHTTTQRGFPGDRAGALSLGGSYGSIPPLADDWTEICQSCDTLQSLVDHRVQAFFPSTTWKGRATLWGGVRTFWSIMIWVYWWRTRRRAAQSWRIQKKIWHRGGDLYRHSFGKYSLKISHALELFFNR